MDYRTNSNKLKATYYSKKTQNTYFTKSLPHSSTLYLKR